MSRFNVQEADNYGGQGGAGFFSLKNNHEVANVRFLYDSVEDIEGFAVHELKDESGNKFSKTNINCLREYGDPIENCPFCQSGKYPVKVKYFVPLFNQTTGRGEVWERGRKFGNKLSALCSRYPHLVSHTFDIERNGEAGDQQTTYEIYETGQDNATLNDFPEPTSPLGGLVLDKSAEEMQYFLDRGVFPDDPQTQQPPIRRDNGNGNNQFVRRTPANSNNNRSKEVF